MNREEMRQIRTAAITLGLLFVAVSSAKDHEWSTGKVLNSKATREIRDTSSTSVSSTSGDAATTGHATLAHDYLGIPTVDATSETSAQSQTLGSTHTHQTVFQDNQVVIEGQDYVYVLDDLTLKPVGLPTRGLVTRAIANHKHGCRFVVGDEVKYEQEKGKLTLLDADGKECKLDILRQERRTDQRN